MDSSKNISIRLLSKVCNKYSFYYDISYYRGLLKRYKLLDKENFLKLIRLCCNLDVPTIGSVFYYWLSEYLINSLDGNYIDNTKAKKLFNSILEDDFVKFIIKISWKKREKSFISIFGNVDFDEYLIEIMKKINGCVPFYIQKYIYNIVNYYRKEGIPINIENADFSNCYNFSRWLLDIYPGTIENRNIIEKLFYYNDFYFIFDAFYYLKDVKLNNEERNYFDYVIESYLKYFNIYFVNPEFLSKGHSGDFFWGDRDFKLFGLFFELFGDDRFRNIMVKNGFTINLLLPIFYVIEYCEKNRREDFFDEFEQNVLNGCNKNSPFFLEGGFEECPFLYFYIVYLFFKNYDSSIDIIKNILSLNFPKKDAVGVSKYMNIFVKFYSLKNRDVIMKFVNDNEDKIDEVVFISLLFYIIKREYGYHVDVEKIFDKYFKYYSENKIKVYCSDLIGFVDVVFQYRNNIIFEEKIEDILYLFLVKSKSIKKIISVI